MSKKFPYKFLHLETALTAFIASLEGKVHRVFPNIPVLMYNVDDSYILIKKYTKTEMQELYSSVPRITIDILDIQAKMDENGSQYIRMNYIHDEDIYNTQFRQVVTGMNININLVSSNFLKMLQYWEFLVTLFCIDNVFTYSYMGNNYAGRFVMSNSPENEKPPLSNSTSESKNYVSKLALELSIKPSFVRLETIRKHEDKNNFIFDTDIIVDGNGEPIGQSTSTDATGTVVLNNSLPNSQTEFNDVGLSNKQEKRLLKDRKFLKKSSNVFDIESTTQGNPDETYKTKLIVDQLKTLD